MAPATDCDRFCETCGARVGRPGIDERTHAEVDLGTVAAVSDRGLHHARNEDAFFVSRFGDAAVVVVCDGVSTSGDARAAAQLAADTSGRALVIALPGTPATDGPPWDPAAVTATAIDAAQQAVADSAADLGNAGNPPASTLASVVWDGHTLQVGWVGDTRVYWVGSDGVRLLTDDDSVTGTHTLTRWLGADAPPGPPNLARPPATGGGCVVVCSDGFWNHPSCAAALSALVASPRSGPAPIDLARRLVHAALTAGGDDNVTVAVMTIGSRPASRQLSEEQP